MSNTLQATTALLYHVVSQKKAHFSSKKKTERLSIVEQLCLPAGQSNTNKIQMCFKSSYGLSISSLLQFNHTPTETQPSQSDALLWVQTLQTRTLFIRKTGHHITTQPTEYIVYNHI